MRRALAISIALHVVWLLALVQPDHLLLAWRPGVSNSIRAHVTAPATRQPDAPESEVVPLSGTRSSLQQLKRDGNAAKQRSVQPKQDFEFRPKFESPVTPVVTPPVRAQDERGAISLVGDDVVAYRLGLARKLSELRAAQEPLLIQDAGTAVFWIEVGPNGTPVVKPVQGAHQIRVDERIVRLLTSAAASMPLPAGLFQPSARIEVRIDVGE